VKDLRLPSWEARELPPRRSADAFPFHVTNLRVGLLHLEQQRRELVDEGDVAVA
jgi:hypothetical protein